MIESPNASEQLIGLVLARRMFGEANPVGQQDNMLGDFLGCGQILVDHRGRHGLAGSRVGESFASRAVYGKFAGRIKALDPRQVGDRVVVLGVGEAAQDDWPWIACMDPRLLGEILANPRLQPRPLGLVWLLGLGGRHLVAIEYLANLLPKPSLLANFAKRLKAA